MADSPHALVVGAGINGVSTAVYLRRRGWGVTLVDREGPAAGASYGNGGVIVPSGVVPVTGPGLIGKAPGMLFRRDQPLFLRWGYLPRLLPWLRRYLSHCNTEDTTRISRALAPIVANAVNEHVSLAITSPAAAYIQPEHYYFYYADRAAFEADAFGWSLRREAGIRWTELEGDALREAVPDVGPAIGFAVQVHDHGRISDPGAYVRELAETAERDGVRLMTGSFQGAVIDGGRASAARIDGQQIDCDALALTTGVWAMQQSAEFGVQVPLESERGYHLELYGADIGTTAPAMFAAGKFVLTPMRGRLRLAGIVEFGGLESAPAEPPWALLERQVRSVYPAVQWHHSERWMGHRPAPADSIPLIGAVPRAENLFLCTGHHHIGMTAGARSGRLLAAMITGDETPEIDPSLYAPARFAG